MTAPPGRPGRRVVVTGLGAVSTWGWSVADLWRGLHSAEPGIEPTRRFDTRGQRTRVAGEVSEADALLSRAVPGWRTLSRADRFAVAAAREAAFQAGLAAGEPGLGVFFAGSTAGMAEAEEFHARLVGRRPGRPRLGLLASQQINGPGDAVARALGATGPVYTVSSACSSGAQAIGEALEALRSGETPVALAGGSDSLCGLTYSGFNSLRAVDEEPCRPFRHERAGLSLGEGAGVLVLETLERALERGARPLAELLGAGASCDAHHMTAPHPEGKGAAVAIRRALEDAGRRPEEVTFVNTHGTGTALNDAAEWNALHRVFGDSAATLPATATKGSVGHLLGSAGAIEAVVTVRCLMELSVHPTPGTGEIDPAFALDLVREDSRAMDEPALALSTSFAFGGANAALVLTRWSGEGSRDAA